MPVSIRLLTAICMLAIPAIAISEAPPAARPDAPSVGELGLASGDYYRGELASECPAGALAWRTEFAVQPFVFPIESVKSARFKHRPELPAAEDEFCFELTGGQALFGKLASCSADSVVLISRIFGRLEILRSKVMRIYRPNAARGGLEDGLQGLSGWTVEGDATDWVDEAGDLVSEQRGAALLQELKVPQKFCVDVEAEWNKDFGVTLDFGGLFRIESWQERTMAIRETDAEGDLVSVGDARGSVGSVNVRCFVDQASGEVRVVDHGGKLLATLKCAPIQGEAPPALPIRLTNYSSYVRLKQLVVKEWDGFGTDEQSASPVRVRLADGRLLTGTQLAMDEGADELTATTNAGGEAVPLAQATSIVFAIPEAENTLPCWLSFVDGAYLSGEIRSLTEGQVRFSSPLLKTPLTTATENLRAITNIAASAPAPQQPKPKTAATVDLAASAASSETPPLPPRLVADAILSHGTLEACPPTEQGLGMAWRPKASQNASALRRDADLQIDLHPVAPPAVKSDQMAIYRALGIVRNNDESLDDAKERTTSQGLNGNSEYVILTNGDRIRGKVSSFDHAGLKFESAMVEGTFIPSDNVRVWETSKETWIDDLHEEKRRRFLTLPRKQRESPPTHILESINGDFIRSRLLNADAENLYSKKQNNRKAIPRANVQRVVWLPSTDPAAKSAEKVAAAKPSKAPTAVVLLDHDLRVSLAAEGLVDGALVGDSAVLGRCKLAVDDLKSLSLGKPLVEGNASLAQIDWRLRDAIDPIYMQDVELEQSGRMTAGLTSPLVGKPAPEFTLPLLGGESLRLGDLRGKVLVVDFWATWCGPCVKAMPEIASVVDSYRDDQVQLISVNMGEEAESVSKSLERMNISPIVAIDHEGSTATNYLVKSIPHTVIIDQNGKVARVFVGASESLKKQIRFAIDECLQTEKMTKIERETQLIVRLDRRGPAINPSMYGLMTEEINYAMDGGVYAELLRNRTFMDEQSVEEVAPPAHWQTISAVDSSAASTVTVSIDENDPVNRRALPRSVRIDVPESAAGARQGIANEGYWGIPIRPFTKYRASFYARASPGFDGKLVVGVEDVVTGEIWASADVDKLTDNWRRYVVELKTRSAPESVKNRFTVTTTAAGSVWLSLVSLFPPTYADGENGLRSDLVTTLKEMQPKFVRFPGGNDVEGRSLADRFNWKNSIGPIDQRPGHNSVWGYRASDGMGLFELLSWCEAMNAEPMLTTYAGFALNGEELRPGRDLEPAVQEALDEIEYIIGDESTEWGSKRARDGHRQPFPLRYVVIGNQDSGPSYDKRFAQYFDAIRAKYPKLKIAATSYVKERQPDLIDQHYFHPPDSMMWLASNFDDYPRNGPKILVGEWASKQGDPTPTHYAALADAAWMTGLERNADVVLMASYAPLLVNVNPGARQYRTNLIGYDAMQCYGSPSYYAQQMFMTNLGDRVAPIDLRAVPTFDARVYDCTVQSYGKRVRLPAIYAVANVSSDSKSVILKMVNVSSERRTVAIEMAGVAAVDPLADLIELVGQPGDVNSLKHPAKVSPRKRLVNIADSKFKHQLPPYAISVMRLNVRKLDEQAEALTKRTPSTTDALAVAGETPRVD